MHKLKKIIISLVFSLTLMSVFSLSVFAVHSSGGSSSNEVKQWSEDLSKINTNGYTYVYNSTDIATSTLMKDENYVNSWGYDYFDDDYVIEISDISRDADGNITALYFRKPTEHYEYIRAYEYKNIGAGEIYHYLNCNDNLFYVFYSAYSTTREGIHIDWSHISIAYGLVEAGETFDYYDYFGNPKSVTFNGNGGIFGIDNGGNFELPEGEFPKLEEYLPDSSDDKYQSTSLSEYLPAPPDSIDILDWIKYFIDCFKAVFNWLFDNLSKKFLYLYDVLKGFFSFVSDFFKSFFENLRNIFISFFDFKDLIENNYLSTKFAELRDYVFIKFPFFNTFLNLYSDINGLISATTREAPTITFVLPEILGGRTEVVSLDFLNPVIAVTDVIVIAACYLLTIIYSIRAIPNIIGGIGSAYSGLDRTFNDFDNSKK